MCTFALAIGALGTVVSAAGSIMQGQQQAALANAQASAYEQQAEAERRAGGFEMMRERRKQELEQAQARAAVGASGVAFQGSPTEVLVANAGESELDLQAILYGSRLRQNQLRDQAAVTRWSGRQARTASFINAGAGLLSHLGSEQFVSGISNLYDPDRAVRFGQSVFR